jgi:DNA-binding transcriptional LysR family regulator
VNINQGAIMILLAYLVKFNYLSKHERKTFPMDFHQITLKQLRGFTSAMQIGSISGAAKQLHLTSPAVSLQLRELEKSAGIPLFERSKSGLMPTSGGKVVLEFAAEIRSALIACSESLDELSGTDRGEVSVGVVSTARYFAPTVLAAFNKLYPDVKLQLQVGNRETTIGKLENLELDFAITGRPPSHFEVRSEYIGKHPQIIIASPDHKFSGKKKVSISSLKDQTFLLREPGSGTRSVIDNLFSKNKFLPSAGVEFGSNETIKQAVMAGMGIALISAHTVAAELEAKRLISLNVEGLPINKKWFVVKHKNKRLLPSSQALWDFFAHSGKNYLPGESLA